MGWAGGSVRGRLVLAFVAVAVLAAVLIGVITLSLIRLVPERGLEQQLADQAQAVSDTLAGPRPARQLCALARVLRRGETEVYRLNADATPRHLPACQAPNRRGPLAPVPEVDLSAALAEGEVVTGTGNGLAWAVVPADRPALGSGGAAAPGVRPAVRSGGGVLLVHEVRRLGLSLLPVVAWRLLLATALAVAVAALAAWLLAGRLTAPLGRLVTAARRVGYGDLSTRVRVDGDGEVAEVAAAFNDMAAGLERAQAEQRAFLASVGHELKTPLTTVQGYTEGLLDGTIDDSAERRRSLARVHAETIRLARLVQDLLDLARLGRGQFAVSTVDADVGAVLREAAGAAVERAAGGRVTDTTRLGPRPGHRQGPLRRHGGRHPGRVRSRRRHRLPPHPAAVPRPPTRPPAAGYDPTAAALDWLSSSRWPSGSRKKHRTSHSDSTGGVRNSAPRPRSVSYAARQPGTRIVMAWATVRGSAGGAKVTSGLSAVGAPPVTSSSQVPKTRSTTEVPPYSRYSSAPRTSR